MIETTKSENAADAGSKDCRECAAEIPANARLCKECKSYQDWRRYLVFSQTTLVLLVAMFSVIAAASPHLAKLTPYNSRLTGTFVDFRKGRSVFLVSNDGRAPGIAVDGTLSFETGPSGETTSFTLSLGSDEQTIVSAGDTRLVSVANEGAALELLKIVFRTKTSEQCAITLRTRNFDGSSSDIEHKDLCVAIVRAMFYENADAILGLPSAGSQTNSP